MKKQLYAVKTSGEEFSFSFGETGPVELADLAGRFETMALGALRVAHRQILDSADASDADMEDIGELIVASELGIGLANAARRAAGQLGRQQG